VRTDAELQNLGATLHTVAEDLAGRARDGDPDAVLRLGYLSGAVTAGASKSNGISAELARRVETATVTVSADRASARALRTGAQAGATRG
jgi:hypothetical protein